MKKMKKLNKKGFTLIEMLVVIAIIAILVAIIIPTVTSATSKAKASTDAANLRSAKAVITIGVLDDSINSTATVSQADNGHAQLTVDGTKTIDLEIPYSSKLDGGAFKCEITAGAGDNSTGSEIHVWYGSDTTFTETSHGITYYAEKAGESGSTTTTAAH